MSTLENTTRPVGVGRRSAAIPSRAITGRLVERLSAVIAKMAPDPEREIGKTARREAARRAVDHLMR